MMTADEIQARFAEEGYCILEDLLDSDEAERLDSLARSVMDSVGRKQSPGYVALEAVLNHIPDFAPLCIHPLILEVAEAVLGKDCVMAHSFALKWSKPGAKPQGRSPLSAAFRTHGDWPLQAVAQSVPGSPTPPWGGLAVRWMLTDFTPENGATRIIPFSHHVPRPPSRDAYPQEIPVTGKKGTAFLYHNGLWHRAAANTTSDQHRMLGLNFYIPAGVYRPPEEWPLIKREAYAQFPPRLQQLLERSLEPIQ
jgi:ectoine hydroxylase-related dioxygenase (phytanoyl-CoA dioxygenase family)